MNRYRITNDEIEHILNRRINTGITDIENGININIDGTTYTISREELNYIRTLRASNHFIQQSTILPSNLTTPNDIPNRSIRLQNRPSNLTTINDEIQNSNDNNRRRSIRLQNRPSNLTTPNDEIQNSNDNRRRSIILQNRPSNLTTPNDEIQNSNDNRRRSPRLQNRPSNLTLPNEIDNQLPITPRLRRTQPILFSSFREIPTQTQGNIWTSDMPLQYDSTPQGNDIPPQITHVPPQIQGNIWTSDMPLQYDSTPRQEFEEDIVDSETFTSDSDSVGDNDDVSNCINDNLITLDKYSIDDNPILIYILNSVNKFEKAICITQDEWNDYLKSDINTEIPSNIMCLANSPIDRNNTGVGSKPTNNIIIRLPINQMYITLGSAIRINKEFYNNKIWYALPLYNKKRRRVSNIQGIIGSSMNHGQIPGFIIYKLLRRDQVKNHTKIKETDDYPRFTDNKRLEKVDIDNLITNILL